MFMKRDTVTHPHLPTVETLTTALLSDAHSRLNVTVLPAISDSQCP